MLVNLAKISKIDKKLTYSKSENRFAQSRLDFSQFTI